MTHVFYESNIDSPVRRARMSKPMKILVAVKRVVDANVPVRIRLDGSGVETANVKMALNPFCEIAVEEALRLREAGHASEVVVATAGVAQAQEQLRSALAMGADRAIHVQTDAELQPLGIAKLLHAIVNRERPDLVLLGKQSIDGDNNQAGQMLAGLLGWGQATFAARIEAGGDLLRVVREVDGGTETVELPLPAVVTADLRLNQPRFASLPNIMKARAKPIETLTPDALGVDVAPRFETLAVAPPPPRRPGVMLADVGALAQAIGARPGGTP